MKALKSIGQVLAAIVYTCIFTGLLYMILVLPLAWLLTLKPVVLILVLVMLGGFLQFVVFGLQTLLMVPYAWIVKNNVVALVISVGLMIFNLIRNDVALLPHQPPLQGPGSLLQVRRGGEHHGSHSSGQKAVQVLPLNPFGGKPGGMTKRKTLQLVGFQVKGFCYGSP